MALPLLGVAAEPVITSRSTVEVYYSPEAGQDGLYFSFPITATGEPTSFDATGLPPWCTINKSTGYLFGTTDTAGVTNVVVSATNASGTGSAALQIRCHPAAVLVTEDEGTFYPGDTLGFSVSFNAPVYVTGAPRLKIRIGTQEHWADYASGSGTSGLRFSHAITEASGYGRVGVSLLELNGGTIREVNGLEAGVVLPMRWFRESALVEPKTTSATGRPTLTVQPTSRIANAGTAVTFTAGSAATSATYQWQFNGVNLGGATSANFTTEAGPANAGVYTAVVTDSGASVASSPAVLGVISGSKVLGAGAEVGTNIRHPNGNIYDQVLLQGPAISITANPGEVTRVSFVDLSNDIVQVEFAGAGTLSIVLESASAPAAAVSYNQAGVNYVKGHARIIVADANESTHVSVFTVGRGNAVNQTLFREGVEYDGVADIASLSILSANGKFGGVRAGNASFVSSSGLTGLFAPNVEFTQAITIGDISAANEATPVLLLGAANSVQITGGDLLQANNQAVQVSGVSQLRLVNGMTSHSELLPAQPIRGRLEENGADVTTRASVVQSTQ